MSDTDRLAAKSLVSKKLEESSISCSTVSQASTSLSTTNTFIKYTPLEKLATLCGRTITPSSVNDKVMSLDEEISSYIKSARSFNNFQEFWVAHDKQLPRLASLVRRVNVIPTTSICSEALFSIGNFLQRKQRSSLSSKTLRYLLVLKNRHVLDKFEHK